MPQMFPMPFVMLMLWIGVLILLSMIRIFWFSNFSSLQVHSEADKSSIFNFKQTW